MPIEPSWCLRCPPPHAARALCAAQVSSTVLRRMLCALPHLRDALIGAAATFTARIQEDYVDVSLLAETSF